MKHWFNCYHVLPPSEWQRVADLQSPRRNNYSRHDYAPAFVEWSAAIYLYFNLQIHRAQLESFCEFSFIYLSRKTSNKLYSLYFHIFTEFTETTMPICLFIYHKIVRTRSTYRKKRV